MQNDAFTVVAVHRVILANQQPRAGPAGAGSYNTIFTCFKNLNTGKGLQQKQPKIKFLSEPTFQTGRSKGFRLGGGVQDRGKEIVAYRGADTIVNPANPATAIDDPTRPATTPVFTPKGNYTTTATMGYNWKMWSRPFQANLVITNLCNDRTVIYAGQNGGAAITAQRPRDGDYKSPAREACPVAFALTDPITFSLSLMVKL